MPATAIRWSSAPRATIQTVEQLFRKHWPTSAAVYLPNNEVPKPGTIFTNPKLAETYARILKEAESAGGDRVAQIERARKAWSHGFVAEAIDKFCRTQEVMDVSGSPHKGVLSADDMARWVPTVEAPLTYDYGRYTVQKAGVWSQGPVMLQQLALLKGFAARRARSDQRRVHPSAGRMRQARLMPTARNSTAIPNSTRSRSQTLLSDAYNDERRKLISDKASLDFTPGSVEGFGAVVKLRRAEGQREAVGAMGAGEPTVGRFGEVRGDTVHFDIIDTRRQHDLGDAVGRLAAILAGHSRARLLPRQPRADVLAGGKPSRPRSRRASGRAPRCRRPWRCATASRISPGARPAATSRTSGSRSSSCATSIAR